MTPKLKDYIEEGWALDADEREIAVLALQQVDDNERRQIDSAWDEPLSAASAEARDEFLDARAVLAIEDGKLGEEFADADESAIELMLQWPEASAPYLGRNRQPAIRAGTSASSRTR